MRLPRPSGVSKVTIYSYFPTKADLFEASITHRIEAQFSTMEWSRLDPRKPADALAKIGRAFLALMRSPDVVNQHRALYGALGKDAGPAASFFEAGPLAIVGAGERLPARRASCGPPEGEAIRP